jgi:lathosterol oxidase
MDVILEVFDTFLFDRIYATAFPATASTAAYNAVKAAINSSAPIAVDNPTAYYNQYHFQPATKYFTLEPSIWAYRTSWPRDDVWRQLISLYLITA